MTNETQQQNMTPFNITREEVLELAAQKLCDAFADDGSLAEMAESKISKQVNEIVSRGLKERVDNFLTTELEALMAKEIVPVDIWGDRSAGPATTIRNVLHQRAREFWDIHVDEGGRPSSYGGSPRHEHLMKKILQEEFSKAVKDNATVIIAEFKKAILASSQAMVKEHIERLIK